MADYPTSPGFQNYKLTSFQPSLVSYSQNGKRQARKVGGHRWSIDAEYAPTLSREEFMPIYSFLISKGAQVSSFTLQAPKDLAIPRGVGTGTPLVNGGSQTGNSLITNGWTPSQTGIMKAGDIFTISGDAKVYMVVADANSDSGGNATLTIEPALLESPSNGAGITVDNCEFTVSYIKQELEYMATAPYIYDFSVSFIEALT